MTDTALLDNVLADKAVETFDALVDRIDPQLAHQAVGQLSVALGALAVVAPRSTAGLFGVRSVDKAVPLLVRMVGVRNALAGVRTLNADGDDLGRALRAGLVLGAVDATAVVLTARSGAITKKAAAGLLLVLGSIAVLGVAASRGE